MISTAEMLSIRQGIEDEKPILAREMAGDSTYRSFRSLSLFLSIFFCTFPRSYPIIFFIFKIVLP